MEQAPGIRQQAIERGCQCAECETYPHASDCAVHNAPALPEGACDCKTEVKP
jgi:hypothetical protein